MLFLTQSQFCLNVSWFQLQMLLYPNKTGLFEGSLFWVGVNLTPLPISPSFIFQEELIKYQYDFTQLLNNLFKVR